MGGREDGDVGCSMVIAGIMEMNTGGSGDCTACGLERGLLFIR